MKALKFNPFFKGTVYVCGNHFKDNDFAQFRDNRIKVHLKRNAVPSLNLPNENSMIAFGDISLVVEELDDLSKENITEQTKAPSDYFDKHTKGSSYDQLNRQANAERMDMGAGMCNVGAAFEQLNHEVLSNVPEILSVFSKPKLEVDVDCDMEEDIVVTEEENRIFMLMEEETVKRYEDKCLQTSLSYEDKCLQTNLAYDESLKKITLIDMLKSNDMLNTWTGIKTFSLLQKIVNCITNLSSAKAKMLTFKATPETLIILVMARRKTNLSFKQLACLFGLHPSTTATYFHEFNPILKAVLSPAI